MNTFFDINIINNCKNVTKIFEDSIVNVLKL